MMRSGGLYSRLRGAMGRRATDARWALAGAAVVLSCLNAAERLRSSEPPELLAAEVADRPEKAAAAVVDLRASLGILQQKSLFEPAVPLPSRRVAKQSVDRIMGMLSLNAILESGGRYVAYIHVKGSGLRRFREGEGIEELFRVTRIEARRVEMDVAGEPMKLEL